MCMASVDATCISFPFPWDGAACVGAWSVPLEVVEVGRWISMSERAGGNNRCICDGDGSVKDASEEIE